MRGLDGSLSREEAANVCASPIGMLGFLAEAHRGDIRCCY
jgi:hypothetical protein